MASETFGGVVPGVKVEGETGKAGTSGDFINDEHFMRDLNRLKELRSFLIQEAINISPDDDSTVLSFGTLNQLRRPPVGELGRAPTLQEWSDVERYTQNLFRLLTEPLRRRFILGGMPAWLSVAPIGLAIVALFALVGAVVFGSIGAVGVRTLPFYLIWLICLGAIGSIASIGMNALSVQQDITFDLSNRRLMLLRVALGALFGLVLTLPFGFKSFLEFAASIHSASPDGHTGDPKTLFNAALFLLLPFILGFSTSLVIMILNRFIDAVQAFFGKPSSDNPLATARQSTARNRT
jgi:hypothetical protein